MLQELNKVEAILDNFDDLNVYSEEQLRNARKAKEYLTKHDGKILGSNKQQAKKKYFEEIVNFLLAEHRDFSEFDKAFLECIDIQVKEQIPYPLGHDISETRYWVMVCKHEKGIHSFIMMGMTINETDYICAAFGMLGLLNDRYLDRSTRLQNEIPVIDFKNGFKFINYQGKPFNGYHSGEISYKGFALTKGRYNHLIAQISTINPAIPCRYLDGNQQHGYYLKFFSLQAIYQNLLNKLSRERICISDEKWTLSVNCRNTCIEVLEKLAGIQHHDISAYPFHQPSSRTFVLDGSGTIKNLRLLPIYQPSASQNKWWIVAINNKRYIAQLAAVSATYLLIHYVFSLGVSVFFFDWALLVGSVCCYELNRLSARDPYPVTASVLSSLLMMLLVNGLLVSINVSCWSFCAVMLGCALLNWFTHQDRYQMAGFIAFSGLMFLFSGMGLLVPMNVGFSHLVWHSVLPSLVYASIYYLTYHLIPRNDPSPANRLWNQLHDQYDWVDSEAFSQLSKQYVVASSKTNFRHDHHHSTLHANLQLM